MIFNPTRFIATALAVFISTNLTLATPVGVYADASIIETDAVSAAEVSIEGSLPLPATEKRNLDDLGLGYINKVIDEVLDAAAGAVSDVDPLVYADVE